MVQARSPVPKLPPDFYGSLEDWEALHEDWLDEEWESDEPPLESDLHRDQINLLIQLLKYYWRDRPDFYVSGNTTVFYDPQQRVTRNFRGPDFYVVLGADPRPRKSWMLWKEQGRYPNVVIELLSDSTARVDRTAKKQLYQDTWRVTDYILFDPHRQQLSGFHLVGGSYQALDLDSVGRLWVSQLELFVGLHEGMLWLFTPDGERVLLAEEAAATRASEAEQRAIAAEQKAAEAEAAAEKERLEKERLQLRLRELGVDPQALD